MDLDDVIPNPRYQICVKEHRDLPVGGHLISLRVDRLCPRGGQLISRLDQVRGVTPFPVVASASRRLLPSVRTR
jgi:hypothetical protein